MLSYRRIITLSLTAVLIISTAACAKSSVPSTDISEETAETATESETADPLADSLPKTDLKGFEFTIGSDQEVAKNIYLDRSYSDVRFLRAG